MIETELEKEKLTVKVLRADFQGVYPVRAFRSALAKRFEDSLFDNHLEQGGLSYRYPRVQYKRLGQKMSVLCLQEAVERVGKFFGGELEVVLDGEPHKLHLSDLKLHQHRIVVWQQTELEYTLDNWSPFSQQSHQQYERLDGVVERMAFLQERLLKHIMAFLRSVEAVPSRRVEVRLLDLSRPDTRTLHHYSGVVFPRVRFATNVMLPQFIGLGRHSAIGFGILKRVRKEEE
jgi:hypothetical protein